MASVLPDVELSGIFLDLGISSPQLDEAARGFRPEENGPLDLRFDTSNGPTAADFLREAPREELLRVLQQYGDPSDPHAAVRVADAVCLRRSEGSPPQTTTEFAELVAACRGYEYQAMHPAKTTFQALRIHLNNEFGQLRGGVAAALDLLKSGGRLGVLTWKHSECALLLECLRGVEVAGTNFPLLRWHKARPVRERLSKAWGFVADVARRPTPEEMRLNSRSRSAVFHVLRKNRGFLCSQLEATAATVFGWSTTAANRERAPSSKDAAGAHAAADRSGWAVEDVVVRKKRGKTASEAEDPAEAAGPAGELKGREPTPGEEAMRNRKIGRILPAA
eukprot:CAMPEP_0171087818 /NCGR_PEP_ID=MMETSP0766_2-20121228/20388_1 /TAXON_ID=439317 /ORGANISM="Gambierdiscus australes, Strain CAWD 149" /LENGTH=334 /DNA_ID=CAMNT_0011545549 /DNA_START=6 /DNA_END=1006 /DNA_ORIENTATION=+